MAAAEAPAVTTAPISADLRDASCILQIDGVQCYRIVRGHKELIIHGPLQVLSVQNDGRAVVFLRAENFSCPLVGKQISSLRMQAGSYVFPLPNDEFYGLIFPAYTTAETIENFEYVLQEHTDFHSHDEEDEAAGTATGTAPAATGRAQVVEDPDEIVVVTPGAAAAANPPKPATYTAATYGPAKASPGTPATAAAAHQPAVYTSAKPQPAAGATATSATPGSVSAPAAAGVAVAAGAGVAGVAVASQELVPAQTSGQLATTGGDSTAVTVMNKAAYGIAEGGKFIGAGIVTGATYLGTQIRAGGEYIKTKVTPNEQAKVIDPAVRSRVHTARQMTGVAVKVSGAMVLGVVAMAQAMGQAAAAAIGETEYGKKWEEGSSGPKMQAAKGVGVSTIQTIGTLFTSLETAGRILLVGASESTAGVIQHKYGDDAGQLATEVGGVVVNVAQAAFNVEQLGVKSVTLMTTKETAKNLLGGNEAGGGAGAQQALPAPDPMAVAVQALIMPPPNPVAAPPPSHH